MGAIRKAGNKKGIAFCLLFICFFIAMFSPAAYAAPDSNQVTLIVEQTFTKPAASSASDTFTYTLTAKETGNPMPTGSLSGVYTLTASCTGSVNVGPISFNQTGIYNYEIEQQVASPKNGYTYDTQVYTVTVYVDSSYNADVIIRKQDGAKTGSIVFENAYNALTTDPSLIVDPPVNKTVSGNPSEDGTFTFKLTAQNPSQPMPEGSVNGVKIMTIVGSGTEDFGTWSYTEAGTYYYTVSEVNNGESGYTYDETVYTITDSVGDENGQLVLTRTVTNNANKQVSALNFINKYSDTSVVGGTTGPKTGDDAMTGLYQALLAISGLALMACMLYLLMDHMRKKQGDSAFK